MKNYIQNPHQKVVITFDGNQTLARIYENNKVVAKGVATCSPEDEFNLIIGAMTALTRASATLDRQNVKQEWVVVHRKPRVGDYIRVTYNGYPFEDYGEVLKVSNVSEQDYVSIKLTDHPKCKKYIDTLGDWFFDDWVYNPSEYEVVEPAHKKSEYRKITRRPKPGDYMRLIKSKYEYDSPDYMLKIHRVISDDLSVIGVEVMLADHPGALKHPRYRGINHQNPIHYNHNFNTWEFYEKV